jgi:hypothetical protein
MSATTNAYPEKPCQALLEAMIRRRNLRDVHRIRQINLEVFFDRLWADVTNMSNIKFGKVSSHQE